MKNKVYIILISLLILVMNSYGASALFSESQLGPTNMLMDRIKDLPLTRPDLFRLTNLYIDYLVSSNAKINFDATVKKIISNKRLLSKYKEFSKVSGLDPVENQQVAKKLFEKNVLVKQDLTDYTNALSEYKKCTEKETALRTFVADTLTRYTSPLDKLLEKVQTITLDPLEKAQFDLLYADYLMYTPARKELYSTANELIKKYNQKDTGDPATNDHIARQLLRTRKLTADEITDYTKKIQRYQDLIEAEYQLRSLILAIITNHQEGNKNEK